MGMAIRTPVTEMFGLKYPIVSAPMGWVSGGRLAAAVSNAGGLGLVAGAYGDPGWLHPQLEIAQAETQRPWGVGLITWSTPSETVDLVLSYRPATVFLSFGDPNRYAAQIKAAGCTLICQVQEVEAARQAVAAGADIIAAQGSEAGGHGAVRATLPLLPAVVDAVAPVPVLAAGGIADGRGLAAALMLGAQGALIGTRFFAASESLGHDHARARLVAASAGDTIRSTVFDIVRGFYPWPKPYDHRTLRNQFVERWYGREAELLATLDVETPTYWQARDEGDFDTAAIFAGEGVDLIHAVEPAATLVQRIGAEAEALLRRGPNLTDQDTY
jgi:nitronate monooxygenase